MPAHWHDFPWDLLQYALPHGLMLREEPLCPVRPSVRGRFLVVATGGQGRRWSADSDPPTNQNFRPLIATNGIQALIITDFIKARDLTRAVPLSGTRSKALGVRAFSIGSTAFRQRVQSLM